MPSGTQLATNSRKKNWIAGIAFAFSTVGAICDALQKYLASRMALDQDHLGGNENYAEWLPALHILAAVAAVMTMLESYTLETGNIHLLVHKISSVSKYKLAALCQNTRIGSFNFIISCFVLLVNFFACLYIAFGTIDAMDDPYLNSVQDSDFVKWIFYVLTGLFVLANTPLNFATDGGFFERFVQQGVEAISSAIMRVVSFCKRNVEEESPFRYKGLDVYRVKRIAIDESLPLLTPEEQEAAEGDSQNKSIWAHLMDTSKCYDSELLYIPKNKCSFGYVLWFMMQFVVGTLGAMIEAGFASAIFNNLKMPINYGTELLRIFIMTAAFLQDWGLDGAVSASTVADLWDHPTKREKFSWITTVMVFLLAVLGGAQAFAVGYIGMEEMLRLVLVDYFSAETKVILNYCAGGLSVAANLGVELKVFSAKFSLMFPPALPRTGPLNDSERESNSRCTIC